MTLLRHVVGEGLEILAIHEGDERGRDVGRGDVVEDLFEDSELSGDGGGIGIDGSKGEAQLERGQHGNIGSRMLGRDDEKDRMLRAMVQDSSGNAVAGVVHLLEGESHAGGMDRQRG